MQIKTIKHETIEPYDNTLKLRRVVPQKFPFMWKFDGGKRGVAPTKFYPLHKFDNKFKPIHSRPN